MTLQLCSTVLETNYTVAIEGLSSHFVSAGLISSSDRVKTVSQYRAFATKLQSEPTLEYDEWIHFISSHHELQCRPELFLVYNFSCLECVRSLQMSYSTIPHVSSLYREPRSVSRVFSLLGRGSDLLVDKKFSVWNFLKGNGRRRASMLGKLETGDRKAVLRHEKPVVSSNTLKPSVSRTRSVNSSPSPDPNLSRVSVSVSRCTGS